MTGHSKYSRAGIASIVSSAILLVSVLLLGTSAVLWQNSNLSSQQADLINSYSTKINKIKESLSIEKIWFGTVPQKFINITMTNQGSLGINVTQVQFSTSSGTSQFPVINQLILSKQTGSVKIKYSYLDNILTSVVITTSRGATFSTSVLPP